MKNLNFIGNYEFYQKNFFNVTFDNRNVVVTSIEVQQTDKDKENIIEDYNSVSYANYWMGQNCEIFNLKCEAVCAIIKKADYFVSILSKKRGKLGLPGGKVDKKETSLQAIVREVKEETNLDVIYLNYLGCTKAEQHICALFQAFTQGEIKSSDEGEVKFATREELVSSETSGYPKYNEWAFNLLDQKGF